MSVDSSKVLALVQALVAKFEDKRANKKDDISGDFSSDTTSYPTVKGVKTWVGNQGFLTSHQDITGKEDTSNKVISWSSTTTDGHYPSEKLVKDSLDGKQATLVSGTNLKTINNTSLLGSGNIVIEGGGSGVDIVTSWSSTTSNDKVPSEKLAKDSLDLKLNIADAFSGDYDDLTDKPTIPSDVSDLTDSTGIIPTDVSDLTDTSNTAFTPKSHTHGNLTNDGKLGTTSGKPVITTTGGAITTGAFGTSSGQFAEGNHTHSSYAVTLEKQATAETGYAHTYVIKQGGSALSPKINIPKDFLVKSGEVKTCTTANVPVQGYNVGDKYLDFVVNVAEGSATDEHIYILVKDLVDVYTADNSTLQLSNGQFSVKSGGIGTTQLASGVVTSLGYADTFHSSAAAGISSSDITAWNGAVTNMLTISDVDGEIDDYLDAITEALTPSS